MIAINMPDPMRLNIGPSGTRNPGASKPSGSTGGTPPGDSAQSQPNADLLAHYERLRHAVEEEPHVTGHRLFLAEICLRLGRKEEAKGILLKASELDPSVRTEVRKLLGSAVNESELAGAVNLEDQVPFYQDAANVLRYPLRGNGPVLLIGGGVVFTALQFLLQLTTIFAWIVALIIAGYVFSYMMSIINSASQGEKEPPDYPDYMDFWDSILGPFWTFCCAGLVPLGLPLAYLIAFGPDLLVILPMLAMGLLYWPMALIAGAIFGNSWAPLNVPLVIRAIRITAGEYFPAVLAIYGLIFFDWLLAFLVHLVLPGLVAVLAAQVVGLYFMMVEMSILGRIYFNHQHKIGWFRSRTKRSRPVPSKEAAHS